jgi:hypothetical protein
MKRCSKCKQTKPIEAFNYKYKEKGIRQSHCKQCASRLIRAHYLAHKEYYIKKAHVRNVRVRTAIRNYVWGFLKDHPCDDCGEADPIVLEFDHISEKQDDIGNMVKYGTLERVKREITHCQVRCANCHRRITARRQGWDKQIHALVA